MAHVNVLNINLIKSFCTIVPDSNIALHFIFEEEHFKLKVDYFLKIISSHKISCEILPGINKEINKRLINAVEKYYTICKLIKEWIRDNVSDISKIVVTKEVFGLLERAFLSLAAEASSGRVGIELAELRIVEDALIQLLHELNEKTVEISLKDFFKSAEDQLGRKYTEFSDRQSLLVQKLNAKIIRKDEILPVTNELNNVLKIKCKIRNPNDVEQISETISRMYALNRWYGFVSTDYQHIIRNKEAIEKYVGLIVSDPLYILYHLDRKVNESINPQEDALKKGIPFKEFVKFPSRPGVV